MADLSTNYMDDILAESMNGKRKYRITRADGSFEEVTLEDISEYEQIGSVFGAGDINRTNQAVNEKFDSDDVVDPMETTEHGFAADALAVKNQFNEQNKNMGGLRFGKDGDGNYGYYGADDSLIPFSGLNLDKPIWENPSASTTADFPAQTINLDLSRYKAVLIKCKYFHGESITGRVSTAFCEVGKSVQMTVCENNPPSTFGSFTSRGATVNTNGVVFGISYVVGSSNYPNAYCVPIAIYGIK